MSEKYLWTGLFPVQRRVEIKLAIRNLEPLRIGAGRGADALGSPIDLPVYRQVVVSGNKLVESPVIPGSSLKGVLRTASMALLRSCGISAHSGVGSEDCTHECSSKASLNFDNIRKRLEPGALRRLLSSFCPTCLLYGAPSVSSRLYVGDFVPSNPPARTGVKTGIGINRPRGTAQPRALYTVEFVQPGTLFQGVLRAVNTPNWMLSLLAASILYITDGWLKIGGFKSRGMGLVGLAENSASLVINGGINNGRLARLDEEIDEEDDLGNFCSSDGDTLKCSGQDAARALRRLADSWQHYCKKHEIFEERYKRLAEMCEAVSAGGEEI